MNTSQDLIDLTSDTEHTSQPALGRQGDHLLDPSNLNSSIRRFTHHQHTMTSSKSIPLKPDAALITNELTPRNKRDRCLDYFIDIEAALRGQMLQLQSLSSHALHIEEIVKEAHSPIVLTARALDSSLANLQHILRGNIALIEQVKSTWSLSESPIADSGSTPAPEITCRGESSGPITPSAEAEADSPSGSTLQWDSSSPGRDPFVETPPKPVLQTPTPLTLSYHPDITGLQGWSRIFAPLSQKVAGPQFQSRRVMLSNLPPEITPAQVLQGLYPQSILSIMMLTAQPFCEPGTSSALVELISCEAAAAYIHDALSRPRLYECKSGKIHQAAAGLIPSPSYRFSPHERHLLDQGWQRTLLVRNLPQPATWYFLCTVGVKNLVNVRRSACCGDALVLEFTTIHEASRLGLFIARGGFRDLCARGSNIMFDIVKGLSHNMREWASRGCIKYIHPDFIELQWNRPPFNTLFPTESQPPKNLTPFHDEDTTKQPISRDKLNPQSDQQPHCSWTQYGILAKQRREKSEAMVGEEGGEAVQEGEDMRHAPVPAVVREYLHPSTFEIIDAST